MRRGEFHRGEIRLVRTDRRGFNAAQSPLLTSIDILRARKPGLMTRHSYRAVTGITTGKYREVATMKLSLTVEADTINVLALSMGPDRRRNIDGIELTDLISVVNQNGYYSLLVADEPGKLIYLKIQNSARCPPERRHSSAALRISSAEDNALLFTPFTTSMKTLASLNGLNYTSSGYLLPQARGRFSGLTPQTPRSVKACRRLLVTLVRRYAAGIVHLDAFGGCCQFYNL